MEQVYDKDGREMANSVFTVMEKSVFVEDITPSESCSPSYFKMLLLIM